MKKSERQGKLKDLGRKLGKFKYPALVLLLGFVLLALPGRKEKKPPPEPPPAEQAEESGDASGRDELEQRLAGLLSRIEGAGRVEVLLRLASGSRTVYQTDTSQDTVTDENSTRTTLDVTTVQLSGSGGVSTPAPVQVIAPTYQGALVVAEGADSAAVRLNLVSAVSSLTGLGADKITVVKMKSN